jgi:hypothetical protein
MPGNVQNPSGARLDSLVLLVILKGGALATKVSKIIAFE